MKSRVLLSLTFALISAVTLYSCSTRPKDGTRNAEVEGMKDQSIEERLRPGANARLNAGLGWGYEAAIRENGKTVIFSSGKKSLEPIKPLTEKDLLAIGSVSKMFTGVLIHLAEIEGRFKTDRTLGEIFSELKGTPAGTMTLYRLGIHQSGLPSQVPVQLDDQNPYAKVEKADVLAALKQWKAPATVDAQGMYPRVYSNWGYLVLGLVLEKTYGKSFEEILKTKMLRPLGMKDTKLDSNGKIGKRSKKEKLSGYSLGGDPLPWWNFRGFTAATGGIESSAVDMSKLLEALENPPAGGLGRALTLSMESGIGWDSDPGHLLSWKNGGTAASSAVLMFDREKKRGLFLFTNSNLSATPLAEYAIGKTAKDEVADRLITDRVPSADEMENLKGRFRVTSAVNSELPLKTLTVLESLGRVVGRYDFGLVKASTLLLPGDKDDLWNVAEGDMNLDKLKILTRGAHAKLRITVSVRNPDLTAKTSFFELEKEEVKPEAYPAEE